MEADVTAVQVLAALAGEQRILVLAELISHGPAATSEVAAATGIPIQHVRKAVAALAAVGLVVEAGDGLVVRLQVMRDAVDVAVAATPLGRVLSEFPELRSQLRLGRIAVVPPAGAARTRMLNAVIAAMPQFGEITEVAVTALLAGMTDDPVLVRRLLVDEGLLHRTPDGSRYWPSTADSNDGAG